MGAREYFAGKSTKKSGAKAYFATDETVKNYSDNVVNRINSLFEETNRLFEDTNNYYNGLDTSAYNLGGSEEWYKNITERNNQFKSAWDEIDNLLKEGEAYVDPAWATKMRVELSKLNKERSRITSQAEKDIEFWKSWDEVAKGTGMSAEEAYKSNYYTSKYDGYSYEYIKKAIEGAEKEEEKNWLTSNADYFMTSEEAQKELDMYNNLLDKGAHIVYGPDGIDIKATDKQSKEFKDRIAHYTTIKNNAVRKEELTTMLEGAKNDPLFNDYVKKGKADGIKKGEWDGPFVQGYESDIVAVKEGKIMASGEGYYQKFINEMDDEQYNNYVYFLGKYGKETAEEYLKYIEYDVNASRAKDIAGSLEGTYVLPHLFGLYAGLDQFASGWQSLGSDGYKAPSATQMASGLVRAEVAENEGFIGTTIYDFTTTIGNMAPSILAGTLATQMLGPGGLGLSAATAGKVGGAIGTFGVMAPSAAGNAYQEMLNLGYNKDQAATYGALTGISEASLQYLLGGIGHLSGGFFDDAVKGIANGVNSAGAKWAIEFGREMAGEFGEEFLQEVLDPFFKNFATGAKFEGIDWGQALYAGMLGALSAGVLNGIGEAGTRVGEYSLASDIKKQTGWADTVKGIGNTFSPETLAHKLASKVTEKTSAWELANILHEMHGSLTEQNIADIKYQLEREHLAPMDADTFAKYIAKAVDGENLSKLQIKALDANPVASKVFRDVVVNQNTTVNERISALVEMETNARKASAEAKAAKKASKQKNTNTTAEVQSEASTEELVGKVKEASERVATSESGSTINTKTGKPITITKVTETDGKTATFALEDGTTISNEDVEYASDNEGLLYESAISLGYDANVTNAIVHGFKSVNLPTNTYLNGIDEAIEYGRIGYPMDKISTEGFFATLPQSMQTFAYNLGKESAKADVEKAQAKVDANKGKVTESRKGKVEFLTENKSGMTRRQKASIATLGKVVSDITHNNVYIYESVEKTINGKKERVFANDTAGFKAGTVADNGFINKATGEIYIDLHAGANAEGVILWTLAHELTHFVRQWSPARFNVLADFLMAEYGKQGVDVRELIDQKIKGSRMKNLSRDEAYEEVVADAMQTMFTDTDLASKLERLKAKAIDVWEKIRDFFANLYKRVKGEYDFLSAQTEEAKKVRKMSLETIERLSDLFAEAVVDAGNTYANVDIKAVTGEVDIDGNESSHAMSIRSMVEGAGLSFEFNEKTGEMKVRDMYKGTEVSSVTKEQIADSPLGNIVTLAKQNKFITEAEANKQYGFLAELVNLCLEYHNPGRINVTNFKAETLDPAWGSATYGDVMQKDTNPKKTNAITENVIRQIEAKATDNMMFSERNKITLGMTDTERARILGQKKVVAPIYKGQAEALIEANKESLESQKKGLVKATLVRIGEEFGIFTDYDIDDVGVEITLSKGNLKESVSKDASPVQLARLLPVLKSAVENAIGIESHSNRYFYDNTTVLFENLLGGYVVGKYFVPIRFGLKHSRIGTATLYVIVSQQKVETKKIKAEIVKMSRSQNVKVNISPSAYGCSIPQIIPFVNSKDLLRYLPDDMLSEEQKQTKMEGIAETIQTTNDKNDKKYKEYIESGNLKAAREMVVASAKAHGYTVVAHHGSRHVFREFSREKRGANTNTEISKRWFFAADKETANSYYPYGTLQEIYKQHPEWKWADPNKLKEKGKLYDLFLKFDNPLVVDVSEYDYSSHTESADAWMEYVQQAEANENDGIILLNAMDNQLKTDARESTVYMFKDSAQAKSADTITFDENDNVIPLSQRFNSEKNDFYFSERGSTIYIKDGHTADGESVSFIDLILDGKKKGETRTHKSLTRKWVGIAKDGYVYGRVRFGEPYLISKDSPEYKDAYIEGTEYDLKKNEQKYYYPILETEDFRDNPKPIEKNGNYGTYSYSERILMGSLFSGGGTLEAGLTYQMLDKQFGVEYDGKIASVYASNHGDHIQVGKVEDFDISKHKDIFYLHASPVCHNFSRAKHGAKELQMDIDSAKATAKHLETAMPQVFTVENAPGYRKSQSLKIITDKLTELGYKWDVDVYNSADYGSATSRNRVILRAVKDGELPAKPTKQERTNSWDKVTRDLWNTLSKSSLRPSFISCIENTKNLKHILSEDGKVKVDRPLLILTTTSGHTVTYSWEGEVCPTLTTKCGEAKLVMPDGNIYAVTPEFMGRIQGLPTDYKYPKEKTRAFTIIGNGIPTHLTKAVVGGVLDSAYEQTHNGDILYSERNSNAIDNRSLLANALESVAQNDVEKSWLTKYKSQIESLNEDQNKLAELRAEIQKIRFTKGQDRSKLPALENQAKTLANRISKADKKLLEIEVSKPLKGVLERERAKAYQLGKKKLTEYREKESNRRTLNYYRPRMEKIVSDLSNRLAHPTAKTAIPEAFGASVAKVLSAFNFTTYDNDGNPRPSKANVTRAEARDSLKALANQLSQNSIEKTYGQLDIPPAMLEWIETMATYFEAAKSLAKNEFDVNKMNEVQLESAYKFLRSLQTTINKAGKYYTNASSDVASDARNTIDHVGALPTEVNESLEKVTKIFKWDFASPVTVFDRFGVGGKNVYKMLVKGQSKMADNSQTILDFVDKAYTAKEAKEWRETLTTVTIGGKDYNVPVEMLMGLHCLLKQEDSRRHILEGGGIRFADVKHKGKVTRFENVFFNEIDAMAVEKKLDEFPRARECAEAMQKFMQEQGSSWGNEISMTRFGYHAFTKDLYYPIRTVAAGSEYEAQQKRANIYALLNKSFTKERTPGANNAVIVDGIFSVFNSHMSEMALYNAWALPVIDTIKWFNYKETQDIDAGTPEKSVHDTFRLAYGENADKYIRQLLEAINSQTDNGLSEEWAFLNLNKVNRVAVSWNVRVAVQQPFSITRAFELINPKYVTPLAFKARREAYDELLKYSGIAVWKSLGYYDVDISRPMEAKVLKNETFVDKWADVGMKAAEDGDKFTWTALWNACKKETAEKNPGLKGKELLKKSAERFDDIVLRTQVVDSVLTNVPWKRSKKFFHKSTSAFMSEPLTSYNALLRQADVFLRDTAIHGKKYAVKKNAKGIVRATGIFLLTQLVNAMVTAPLDGLRDDDDYETYLEKVLANFKENAFMNLLPTSMLPYINDYVDYFMYGRTDRSDMALGVGMFDLGKDIYNLCDPDKYSYYKLHNVFQQTLKVGSQLSGFAVSNALRDVLSVYNAVVGELGYGELKFQTAEDTHTEGYKRMYDALVNGNEDRMEELYGQLLSNELDEEKVYNGLIKLVSKDVQDGNITDEEAIERVKEIINITGKVDSEGNPPTDNDIYWMIDKWKNQGENGSTENYSKYDDIFTAMEEGDPSSAIEWHIENKTEAYVEEARREAEENGKGFNEVKARREAKKKAESSLKSAITSHYKKLYKDAYKNGDEEEMKRIRYMLKDTGLYGSTSDLLKTCKDWLKS